VNMSSSGHRRPRGIRWRAAVAAAILMGGGAPARAEPANVSAGEIALLPEYCRAKVWANVPVAPELNLQWLARLGPSWHGLHHYCWGLVNVHRAKSQTRDPAMRSHLYKVAIADYIYTIENSTPDFVLLPEIHMRVGEAYQADRQYARAIDAYGTSVRLKPDYWPAYLRMAETYQLANLPDRAREAIAEGLRQAPDAEALKQRAKELARGPKPPARPASAASQGGR
jgi:tetratricopeptide (TPR) repeat protein